MSADDPTPFERLLARDDGTLASSTISAMCVEPRPENFAALGRVLRRGIEAGGRDDFEAAFRRKR